MVPSQVLKATPNALWAPMTELHSSVARIEESAGRLEGAVNAVIEGQHQLNQRIDRVIVVSVTAGATLTAAMIGGLVAIAILG